MLDFKLIGSRIKTARLEKNITQKQLSITLSITPEYISRMECGRAKINLETLVRVAETLEVPAEYLLSGAVTSSSNYLQDEISQLLEDCTPEKVKAIAGMIKIVKKM